MTDLTQFAELVALDHGLSVVVTLRPDHSPHTTVVNAGVLPHPATGAHAVAFVSAGGTRKLAHLRDNPTSPGYHLNKRHWNTVELDGTVDDEVRDMIEHSYELVVSRLRGRIGHRFGSPSCHTLGAVEANLRRAVLSDVPWMCDLLRQLGWEPTPEQVASGLDVESTEVSVAEADDNVVGLIAITTRHHFHRGAKVTTIDTLVVDAQHRSQGLGERLVDLAVDVANRNGAQAIEVISHPRRVDAHRFYERLGFVVDGNYFLRDV